MKLPEFVPFPKIPRLHKECIVTEKIDGTNGIIYITDDGDMFIGSRNRQSDLLTFRVPVCVYESIIS